MTEKEGQTAEEFFGTWDSESIVYAMKNGTPFPFRFDTEDDIVIGYVNWEQKIIWFFGNLRPCNKISYKGLHFKSIVPLKEDALQVDVILPGGFTPDCIRSMKICPIRQHYYIEVSEERIEYLMSILEEKSPGVTISLGECWYNSLQEKPLRAITKNSWEVDEEKLRWFEEELSKKKRREEE